MLTGIPDSNGDVHECAGRTKDRGRGKGGREDGEEISRRTYLCLENVFELHAGIDLDRDRPAEVSDERELHPGVSYERSG